MQRVQQYCGKLHINFDTLKAKGLTHDEILQKN